MRQLVRVIGAIWLIASFLGVAACASTATPSPPSPAQSTAVSSKATSAPTAKPADAISAASPQPAASSDWKADWDKTVAEAKKEGKIIVAGNRGELVQSAVEEFHKAYPEIEVNYTGFQTSDFAPRVIAERNAGQYLWDVNIGGATTLMMLRSQKVLDPIKPVIVLPDVLDDSKWLGGFNDGLMDNDQQYVYGFMGYLNRGAYVNRSIAPRSVLSKFEQIIEPEWKGKIAMFDPRHSGAGAVVTGYIVQTQGEDWLRKLLNQDVAMTDDSRQALEWVVRGNYPIGMGLSTVDTAAFRAQGLMKDIEPLDPGNPAGSYLTPGNGSLGLINRSPHPNAAKVFINWFLSKDGQTDYSVIGQVVVRRLDVVGGPTEDVPDPHVKYLDIQKEEYLPALNRAMAIAKEIFK